MKDLNNFNRLMYDIDEINKNAAQVRNFENYQFEVPAVSCNECYQANPGVKMGHSKNHGGIRNVSIETDLRNNINNATCDENGCLAQRLDNTEYVNNVNDCNIVTEDTRLSNPASNLRGTGWNRSEWPIRPIKLDNRNMISSRNLLKDNLIIPDAVPLDQSAALPKGGDLKCPKTTNVCAPYL